MKIIIEMSEDEYDKYKSFKNLKDGLFDCIKPTKYKTDSFNLDKDKFEKLINKVYPQPIYIKLNEIK